ncbi:beta-ketoacyl-[acyl-carrier-protein] synthase family protein [Taibaiella lutea]|uniref:3-oxoacyl-[acyl-carrier-protein] synthase 1 n=1 Tax=Taibaiella lutea TaxID=2608001 RepID=A0A5M6CAT2_9BACT|nr:beta-ketoacyl-[acyl-carrier-protein] synthase family protein [Taibaiella lutea]KAA5532244.1 beta-ketoacyl-[acyl-carrier-protein] synthase family protein [Taibaiella lutea]
MSQHRVVITGMGVVAPNANNLSDFEQAVKSGISGIKYQPDLAALGFSCCIGGKPELGDALIGTYFDALELRNFNNNSIIYGVIAGMQAWQDAGLTILNADDEPDWDSGTIFGNGSSGVEKFREAIYKIDEGATKKLGSTTVVQIMVSGISAFLAGKIGLGNQVTTNSSACTTGTESLLMCYERIKTGKAKRMLAGSTSDSGPYIWAGFDAMKVCNFKHNDHAEKGSRPMSATASGFVPGSGAGALVLENLEDALKRGANIYAEVIGGAINAGGQRGSGTMTAPNSIAVQRCITDALKDANIHADEIDAINGHLTATTKDSLEIQNWATALQRNGNNFPYINALKSHVGHCLSASGSIECIAAALQIKHNFLFPNLNCEDLHPDIADIVSADKIPQQLIEQELNIIAKASFGFGDVNACAILKKYKD